MSQRPTFIGVKPVSSDSSEEVSVESVKKYGTPQVSKRPVSAIAFQPQDAMIKRVIAPFLHTTRRARKGSVRRDVNYYSFFLTKKSSALMSSMKNFLANKRDLPGLLYETGSVLKSLTESLGMRLYFVDLGRNQLYQYQKNVTYPKCRINYDIETCKSVACYVARSKEFVMIDDISKDSRFPDGVSYKYNVKPVLCLPIVTKLSTYAVFEMYRDMAQPPYKKSDLKLSVVLCGWIGLCIQENHEGFFMHHKTSISATLHQMVLKYYSQPDTLEILLSEILNFAKKEIDAEKGTFYVITDQENMMADVYEEGISDMSKYLVKKKQFVYFGRENTVACQVFKDQVAINVKDLFNDPRFKTQIAMDEELMIIERTELCSPIITNNKFLGIISLVNKADQSYFTVDDEELMKTITNYAGLALFYAEGQREINQTKYNLDSAYDLLRYHLQPCQQELEEMKSDMDNVDIYPWDLLEFNFYISPDSLKWMPQIYVKMMRDIVPPAQINFDDLYSFILTTRRCYRPNPYHNFEHAFTVAHCMYAILVRNLKKFSLIEVEALMIAALTHDIDHVGVTNNFLTITNHRLSLMYNSSLWENHHCFVTEQLLRKYNIFKNITDENHDAFVKQVRENILFTDLLYYFKMRSKLIPILNNGVFNLDEPSHKYHLRNVCMTMSDLAGQAKPFSVSKRLADSLYREFYAQGDREKEMGFTPLAMMDRDNEAQIPEDQAQFLDIVVLSAASLLRTILPNTEDIYFNVVLLRDTWIRILESRGEKQWRQCESLVS